MFEKMQNLLQAALMRSDFSQNQQRPNSKKLIGRYRPTLTTWKKTKMGFILFL